jgi:hypothetical protein
MNMVEIRIVNQWSDTPLKFKYDEVKEVSRGVHNTVE